MAFELMNWVRSSGYGYEGDQVPIDYKYNGSADTKAAILTANYFLPVYKQLSEGSFLQFTASDATLVLCMVDTVTSTSVTISEITETLPPGSIDTADLADGCVTNPKIATLAVGRPNMELGAIGPAQLGEVGYIFARYSGPATAATSTVFSTPITMATDHAFAIMTAGFSQPITGVEVGAGTTTVHYAGVAAITDTVEISIIYGP
tara:strand:- start:170 stop:784 length:615 start_codon:yes stop_codon:yes gene_type:complete